MAGEGSRSAKRRGRNRGSPPPAAMSAAADREVASALEDVQRLLATASCARLHRLREVLAEAVETTGP